MESETEKASTFNEVVNKAALWRSESELKDVEIAPGLGVDVTYNIFVQVMTYRRQIARNLLQETDAQKKEILVFAFEHCNKEIKKVLGL